MERELDCEGLLFTITEIGMAYKLPVPKIVEKFGFCQVCLGANVPDQKVYPKNSWRCGSWCDGLLPIFKICEKFQADRQKVAELAAGLRPDGTEKMASYAVH